MAPDQAMSEFELRLEIRSSHPQGSAAELATELSNEEQALSEYLREKYGDVSVQIDREESFPVDWAIGYLILKFAGGGVAAGFLKEAGSDAYRWLKKRIKNGSIRIAGKEDDPDPDAGDDQ